MLAILGPRRDVWPGSRAPGPRGHRRRPTPSALRLRSVEPSPMRRRLEIRDSAMAVHTFALWELVDDTQGRLNDSHECIGHHPVDATALRIQHAGGRRETHTFGTLAPSGTASYRGSLRMPRVNRNNLKRAHWLPRESGALDAA